MFKKINYSARSLNTPLMKQVLLFILFQRLIHCFQIEIYHNRIPSRSMDSF